MNQTLAKILKEKGISVDASTAIAGVELELSGVIGSTSVKIDNLLRVGRGSVLELDQDIAAPIELRVGDATVGYGEVFIREDNQLAIRVVQMIGG